MEYEIAIRGMLNGHFLEHRGVNMLGAMFPLIHELENASRLLPSNNALGASSLTIKDIRYGGYQPQESASEFKVIVDRMFVPEESEDYILNKAKTIAKKIYKSEDHVSVNTALAKEKFIAPTGLTIVSEKEFKPWIMDSNHPFVHMAIETLHDAGIQAKPGYWQKTFTEGSYTFAARGIPTIGFGPGSEEQTSQVSQTLPLKDLSEAVFGLGVIIARAIGVPSFGWSSDEI
jgi:acetylornithine deacetylase/succinyl-diaminopimelate desuccinylase-like protein